MGRPGPSLGKGQGSVLIDWLLAAALLGMILAGVARFSLRELERAEINAAAIQLSGWLEVVQRASTRLPGAGCVVTITAAPDGAAPGDVVASVRPLQDGLAAELCNPEANFRLPTTRQSGSGGQTPRHITTTILNGGDGRITFTPRGTVTNRNDVDLVIRHTGSSRAARCLRVNAISGLIEIGQDNDGTAAFCPEDSFSDLI
jgi:hypothetical protein